MLGHPLNWLSTGTSQLPAFPLLQMTGAGWLGSWGSELAHLLISLQGAVAEDLLPEASRCLRPWLRGVREGWLGHCWGL